MGWFDDQIQTRKQQDDAVLEDALRKNARAVLGGRDAGAQDSPAVMILRYFGMPVSPGDTEEKREKGESDDLALLTAKGVLYRRVRLDRLWYRDCFGPLLGYRGEEHRAVALLPAVLGGYYFYDENGQRQRVNRRTAEEFDAEGVCFYRPLPTRSINTARLLLYSLQSLNASDLIFTLLLMLVGTLLGLLTPRLNYFLTAIVAEQGSLSLLLSTLLFMICLSLTVLFLDTVKALFSNRMQKKMSLTVEAATMSRVLSLPPSFFRSYSSGEISARMAYVNQLAGGMAMSTFMALVSSLFSLSYLTQVSAFASALIWPALLVIGVQVVFTLISAFLRRSLSRRTMKQAAENAGIAYSMITGVQKIKLAGAEKRIFARWADGFSKSAAMQYDPPLLIRANNAFSLLISLTGTLLLYYVSVKSGIEPARYYAFLSAYSALSAAFLGIVGIASTLATVQPTLEMMQPILHTAPETAENRIPVKSIRGEIEFSHVFFRYAENMQDVLQDFSLKIEPGEYVAIVGPTGCGKSTIVRLLLGFEHPRKGAVYVDRNDIAAVDPRSLRRQIGTVMQDGKIFPGDIYSNIVISAPLLTVDEAWKAAEIAQIAEDIRQMPMGMNTVISEGSGGISGGQRQRLMIARAIAPKPRVLIMDEATSALDNITQSKVAAALDGLNCTRIVIAHRLTTIQNCDRIIYIENGIIAEDGTYQELTDRKGKFFELVERQRIED